MAEENDVDEHTLLSNKLPTLNFTLNLVAIRRRALLEE